MKRLDLRLAVADARALFARDHDPLIRLAGVFLFLPNFAGLLFLPRAVAQKGQSANDVLLRWFADNAHWLLAEQAVLLLGGATVYRFYLSPAGGTIGDVIRGAAARFFPFLFATLMATLSVFTGLVLFILPGAYLLGRTALAGPAVLAEERGGISALERSFAVTQGHGWILFGVQGLILVAGQLIVVVLGGFDPGDGSPMSAFIDAAAALAGAGTTLATLLFKVAVWRQLGSSSGT